MRTASKGKAGIAVLVLILRIASPLHAEVPQPAVKKENGKASSGVSAAVWEQVPPGGSLQQGLDGSYIIRDKSMNIIKTLEPAAGAKTGAVSIPEAVRGKIPMGGSWTVMPDGSFMIRDKEGKLAALLSKDAGENMLGASSQAIESEALPGGATLTHIRHADGTWSHQFHKTLEDGRVVDYPVLPGDPLYPKGHPQYDSPAAASQS